MKLDDLVEVRRQWNSRRLAYVRREDITGVHWSRSSGGLNHRCPRPFLHGYVWCNAIVRGSLSHSCKHGPAPHLIKICITKKGNRSLFLQLAQAVPLTNERAEWSETARERSILDQRASFPDVNCANKKPQSTCPTVEGETSWGRKQSPRQRRSGPRGSHG